MKVSRDCSLTPDNNGGWELKYLDNSMHFLHLNEAVEQLLELSLVIAMNDVAQSKEVDWVGVQLTEVMEAYRQMVMTWFQTQVPDPHAFTDINEIK